MPLAKYFCTKGYTQMIGMVASMIEAARRVSVEVSSVLDSSDSTWVRAAESVRMMRRRTTCRTYLELSVMYSKQLK